MRYIKILSLLAVAASTSVLGATASASTLTSPTKTTYTSPIEATSTTWELDGPFVTIKCHSVIKANIETHGASNAGGTVTEWSFSGCNYPTAAGSKGTIQIATNGTVYSTGATIHATTSVGTCDWTTNVTAIGILEGGANAAININSAIIPRTSGNFLCGSSGTLTGSYDLVTPNELWVD